MGRHAPWVEELLGFLLTRVDETGFGHLMAHEPSAMSAPYIETAGGRAEQRALRFTGCATCSQLPPLRLYYRAEEWPCQAVRALALPFADDPEYREAWRPEYARRPSGEFLRPDALRRLP
ncbi:hypothetical protein [Streptomyces sp. NPDC020917]|uniref:hypothetical protein n=1 Tax=Streptomyces sp. NPDC020917 TaxID=3365102 RepID=UPI0037A231B4